MLDCIFDINEFYKSHSEELNSKINEYFDNSDRDYLTNDEAINMLLKLFNN